VEGAEADHSLHSELRLASHSSRVVRRHPWRSMDVRLCFTNSPTIHGLLVGRRRMWFPPAARTRTRRGYFWGYAANWGYRCPGGIDYRLHDWPATAPLASITLPYLLELAHEPNSYR
jgi:hypothetical protein